jgi:1,4-alpha-glucan branching enzyme/maltooligosyltrehalose trehalohydrolase
MQREHVMPFGTQLQADGRVRFRLWAPAATRVDLCLEQADGELVLSMQAQTDGWHQLITAQAIPGSRYRYRLDNDMRVPDPASRLQAEDVHGPSVVVDPKGWEWRDTHWRGRPWHEAVIYELHVGSFSAEGDFAAVERRLDHLASLGVTALELMPVADFPGARNWGYDGALLFAPETRYGGPEALKSLIQAAHARGLMVLLDVVYNHFGPEGNYLHLYAPQFFTEHHHTPWGVALNFDGADSHWVREFFIHNALYWLEEYHFDGLRLDAVHAMLDDTQPDILQTLAQRVHEQFGDTRAIHLVLENDDNAARYLRRGSDGAAELYVAQWNDDYHHSLHTLLTGEVTGYYLDYADDPLYRFGRCLSEGFAFQGEASAYRRGRLRGESSLRLPPAAFVNFLQNHDQVGNRAFGERLTRLCEPPALRAALVLLLLSPSPPLLFMGQEWGCHRPFPFFCDFGPDFADSVVAGRRQEFARFPAFRDPAARERIPDPMAESSFTDAVLDWEALSGEEAQAWLVLHRELLGLRHEALIPRLQGKIQAQRPWTRLGARALDARWLLADGSRLDVLANLGVHELPGITRPTAGLLYSTHPPGNGNEPEHRLPGWSVTWYLGPQKK